MVKVNGTRHGMLWGKLNKKDGGYQTVTVLTSAGLAASLNDLSRLMVMGVRASCDAS